MVVVLQESRQPLGIGLDFELKKKIVLGVQLIKANHQVEYPILARTFLNGPVRLNGSFNTFAATLSVGYIFRLNKLSIIPTSSIGAGKIYGYSDSH